MWRVFNNSNTCGMQETQLKQSDSEGLKIKGWIKVYQGNGGKEKERREASNFYSRLGGIQAQEH